MKRLTSFLCAVKEKKIVSIIAITALCIGKINSQTPTDLSLSGTQTESEAIMKDANISTLTLMTYNVWHRNFQHKDSIYRYAEVISYVNPDAVALQELIDKENFNALKTQTGMNGEMLVTHRKDQGTGRKENGIGILWNPAFGTPKINSKKLRIYGEQVAYMMAEFDDFCFIATHYPVNVRNVERKRRQTTKSILNNKVVKNCQNLGKPIYIGGDFNEAPPPIIENGAIQFFIDAGFEVLNDVVKYSYTYPTPIKAEAPHSLVDMILEYNTNSNRQLIKGGWTDFPSEAHKIISDHYPYYVKIKIK